ncbi:alpha,alpha-trehalose-phosphate synthase (UDP-forming) [Pelagibius litoralis]|uniref:Trehalose-6-phosphate synthase n=1 Tax=Pelagibius litoralis TaxID=374515 RepID=A0A967EZF7_9PROT|nr:alpha,alpha-trehalose-phosphate synthase (UDP-forming) [Pelagibius litoralis]NIA70238.1 alpha,alpha-trehalose-phosphate synthase (UDP-forming) [Pelagibius litoralis]
MSRLVVVSNRVGAAKSSRPASEGGLAVALRAALQERGGVWFGWSGKVLASDYETPSMAEVGNITYATIDLNQRDYDDYYKGFANSTLWPLFHYRLDLAEFSRKTWAGYQRVNAHFAHRLQPLLRDTDTIWVHDYHFTLLAENLRSAGCKQKLGFFLHIPWPALPILAALPMHSEIVKALCAFDLLGFQTDEDLWCFQDYIRREAGGEVGKNGIIKAFGRVLRAKTFPIGVDTEVFAKMATESEGSKQVERLQKSLNNRDLIIGVDRLDYSKGLINRVEAFEHLLTTYPDNRGNVVFLQITPPSRGDVSDYVDIRHELEATAGRVNGTFAEYDWGPIRYLNKSFSRRVLAGFHRVSKVGLVTPFRDGMNLVAKEFVAAQSSEDPGVLVLSRFAGAARELDGALIVNPYDTEGVAERLQEALTMPLKARQDRWQSMYQAVAVNDVTTWRENFLQALKRGGRAR